MKAYPNLKAKMPGKGKAKGKGMAMKEKMGSKPNPFMAAMKSASGKGKK